MATRPAAILLATIAVLACVLLAAGIALLCSGGDLRLGVPARRLP